jgi:predicted acetyltransferase
MTETFRTARAEEIPTLARLAGHSFTGRSPEYLEEMIASAHGGVDSILVGELEARPVSLCLMHTFRQWVGGAALPVMGLGMVTVSPDQRRRRAAGRLVTAALELARERGDAASALYPFRISFYQALGYGLAGQALQYVVPPETIPDSPDRVRVRVAEGEADLRALRSVYGRWITTQSGQMERGEESWTRVLAEREPFLYIGESGEAEGYALVRYRADLPVHERFLEVEERAWLSPRAGRAILAWLGSLSDQWRLVAYRAHPQEGFGELLREPRLPLDSAPGWGLWFPAATLMLGPMFRLLDLQRAWSSRPVDRESALTVRMEVRDPQIPDNEGAWSIRLENGAASVERGTLASADCTLRGDIAWISRIFIGAASPSHAVDAGGLEVDRRSALPLLDAALRVPMPWTFDRF